ncbi:MAG: hypothetical protein ACK2UW_00360 [Anaerolineales bacterium]|jgi:hypothetical protein
MKNIQSVHMIQRLHLNRGLVFGILIVGALIAFEIFNYSTTEFALLDLLGDLSFAGIRWATILSIAFCGIDFAGIARLFTPEKGEGNPIEVWYLLAAWLLAALMNAILTWWGISIALVNHESFKNIVIEKDTILKAVPIFVAILVWLIRVLIIGTISVSGDRMFSFSQPTQGSQSGWRSKPTRQPSGYPHQAPAPNLTSRPIPSFRPRNEGMSRQEPTYHAVDGEYSDQNLSRARTKRF